MSKTFEYVKEYDGFFNARIPRVVVARTDSHQVLFGIKKHTAEMFGMLVARAARFEENKLYLFEEAVQDKEDALYRCVETVHGSRSITFRKHLFWSSICVVLGITFRMVQKI
mgnify:CR=1 FL=1